MGALLIIDLSFGKCAKKKWQLTTITTRRNYFGLPRSSFGGNPFPRLLTISYLLSTYKVSYTRYIAKI